MKNKVIELESYNSDKYINFEFKVVPVVCKEYDPSKREVISKKKNIVIEIKDLSLNISKVHEFTEFIMLWKEKSYNTQKNKANTVVRFLNFLLRNNNQFKINTFTDLDKVHGNEYLSSITFNGGNEEYFLAERKTLDKFYLYLSEKQLLNKIDQSIFEDIKGSDYRYMDRSVIYPLKGTIFTDCCYPSNKKNTKRLHILKEEFIVPFIETALEVEPRIALGIFIQCFGGLRRGEVVNLQKNSISMHDWGTVKLEVYIKNTIISDKLTDYNQAENKKVRKQIIYNLGDYLPRLLKMHLIDKEYYAKDGSKALFSNKRNSMLTAAMYSYYFNNVKKAFIKKLLGSSNKEIQMYGMFLKIEKWSTHIGRGIASNFIADSTNNAFEVAAFRGDNNINSSVTYTEDTSKFKNMIYEKASEMYRNGVLKNHELNQEKHQ